MRLRLTMILTFQSRHHSSRIQEMHVAGYGLIGE